MKRLFSLFIIGLMSASILLAAAIELTSAQKRQIARGNKQTVIAVLQAAGVSATDSAAITAAVEEIMTQVANEYDLDADVIGDASEAIVEGAVEYAVDEGNATSTEIVNVAGAVAAAVTEAVVEVGDDLGSSSSEIVDAVQAASSGAIEGSTDAAVGAGADLIDVSGAVAKGTVTGAAQGASNTNTDVDLVAEAADDGNDDGASATGISDVLIGVEDSSQDTVDEVTADPPAPEPDPVPVTQPQPQPQPQVNDPDDPVTEPDDPVDPEPTQIIINFVFSDNSVVSIEINDQNNDVNLFTGDASSGNSVIPFENMDQITVVGIASVTGLTEAQVQERFQGIISTLSGAASNREFIIEVPDSVIVVSPSS